MSCGHCIGLTNSRGYTLNLVSGPRSDCHSSFGASTPGATHTGSVGSCISAMCLKVELTIAAIGLTCTRVSTAPKYRRQSSPSRSGVGTIWNQFWKKRLRVGVRTSGSKSDMPLAKSLRKGTISAGLSADGAAAGTAEDVEAVRGSAFLLAVAVPDNARRIGRNSAGPSGRLETVSMD
jgi:hypothetical protein